MAKNQPDVASGMSVLGTMLSYIKQYGVWNIIKAVLLIAFAVLIAKIIWDPTFIFEKYADYVEERHAKELSIRETLDQKIKALMPVFLYKYHADRVWLIQYHNGVMDWRHGTMRFELCADGITSIKTQYDDFNLTWLDLPYYLIENEIFIGDLADLQKVDPIICHQFIKNHTGYLACILIRDNSGNPSAVFGITWENSPEIVKYRHKIHDYLLNDRGEIKSLIKPV